MSTPKARAALTPAERRRWLLRAFGVGMVGILTMLVFRDSLFDVMGVSTSAKSFGYDFWAYYDAAYRLATSGTPYQAMTLAHPYLAGPQGLYLYTPFPAIIFLPFGALAFHDAATVYLAIQLAALLAVCFLMPVRLSVRLATLGIACLTPPVELDLNLGNVSIFLTLVAVLGWRYIDRPASAVLLALSATFRPTMGLFGAWFLLRGRWRLVAWMAITGIAIFLFTLPFVGLTGWTQYLTVLGNLTDFEHVQRNYALNGVVSRLGLPMPWPTLALYAGYAVAGVAVLLSLRRDRELSYIVVLGATLLVSPLMWDHYTLFLLVTGAFLASRGMWYGLVLPLFNIPPNDILPIAALLGILLPFFTRDAGEPAGNVLATLRQWRRPQPAPVSAHEPG